jgi:hypothetical protein
MAKVRYRKLADQNTPLSPEEQLVFDKDRVNPLYNKFLGNNMDYDTQGYWKNNRGTFNGTALPNTHYPDTFKKSNHPTFSTESQYSNFLRPGGDWVKDDKGVVKEFNATRSNLRNMVDPESYMDINEDTDGDGKSNVKLIKKKPLITPSVASTLPGFIATGLGNATGKSKAGKVGQILNNLGSVASDYFTAGVPKLPKTTK